VQLRTEVFEVLAFARGADTHTAQAHLCEMSKANLYRLKKGQIEARLGTAMRMAVALGTTVERLFQFGASQ
jgi:DNA-binding XRE family transcriptional regulator